MRAVSAAAAFAVLAIPTAAAAEEGPQWEPPHVITRAEWGARPPACEWDSERNVTHVVVHHSADPLSADPSTPAVEAIRAIQASHMDQREWCDIGYNFLIDRDGNIYEGAAGSIERPVIAAHTAGFNHGGVGIGLLGNFSEIYPPQAMLEAVAQLAGWRLGWHGVDPEARFRITAGETSEMWEPGTTLEAPVILAHWDLARTECPGTAAMAHLPWLREAATGVAQAMRATGQFGAGYEVEPVVAATDETVVATDETVVAVENRPAPATAVVPSEPTPPAPPQPAGLSGLVWFGVPAAAFALGIGGGLAANRRRTGGLASVGR